MSNELAKSIISAEFTDSHKLQHQNGPDYEIPTNEIRTWVADGAVSLLNNPPIKTMSVVTLFHNTVKRCPEQVALVLKRDGREHKWTYQQYWNDVRTVAKGFIKLGLAPFHGVCILGFNSSEWHISHLAAIFAGGLAVGLYTTNSSAACFHVINDCEANIIVVENETQLEKILAIRDSLPQLKAIIQYTGTSTHPDVITWNDLLLIGQTVPEEVLERRIKGLATNQCCVLVYTSGTTGNGKGVMVSHDNIQLSANFSFASIFKPKYMQLKIISYLPLSHLAALGCDLYATILYGGTTYFATPDALKGKMIEVMLKVQPTMLFAVPRIVEKMYEKLQEAEKSMYWLTRRILSWAKNQSLNYYLKIGYNSSSEPFMYSLAKKLVFNKLKTAIGLRDIEIFIVAGAPIAPEIKKYFLSLDLFLSEGYGLTESCSFQVCNSKYFKFNNFETVGNISSLKEFKTKILNPDNEGNGEILLYGRNISMGYLKLEKETKEAIDDERWLHSGDLGRLDEAGNLYITGRIKELVITAGGENIPPVYIESEIKKNLPVISNCMLIGDKKKYLTVLITLKTELDMNTLLQTENLTEEAIAWCKSIGSYVKTVTDILTTNDPNVMEEIQAGIRKYNENSAISNAQKVQKFTILPEDFSIGNGDLGPTAKLRRSVIVKKYSDVIEKMYSS